MVRNKCTPYEDPMTKPIQLISPVDGSVYAERMPLSYNAALAAQRATRSRINRISGLRKTCIKAHGSLRGFPFRQTPPFPGLVRSR